MGKITKIEPQAKKKDRVSVYVDDEYWGSLSLAVCEQDGLREGGELDRERWRELQRLFESRLAFDQGLRFLENRMRSRKEMMDHLRAKGFSGEAADEAIGRLETYGYVDDVEFARLWVRERSAVKRAGRRYIEQELLSRGIGRETVSLALEEYPEETEQENARLEFERLLKRYEHAEPCQRKRKIGEGLMRRGFGWDIVGALLSRLSGDEEDI